MRDPLRRVAVSCGLLLSVIAAFSASSYPVEQRSKPALVCKKSVLAALKSKPGFSYECAEQLQEWDEKILKLPARRAALKTLMSKLESFSDEAWWTADAVDLSVCDFTNEPGTLTAEKRQDFTGGEYLFWFFGNDHIRLVMLPDPCYQTEYGGSNGFLLYRNGGSVFVTQVLDGYFSRADKSVGMAFAKLGREEIVEISTGSGGLNPSLTNYYFVIDPRTNHAVPKKLFRGEHGPTNEISSAMLFGAGPGAPDPLKVVRGKSLAPSFSTYIEDEKGKIDDNGRTLVRKILRWNGKIYQ
ncbi:MAG TPA: hypothetical protein VGJ37_01760 [Pyrinomonadaceae bacterium]|jgi:hypothetical protein